MTTAEIEDLLSAFAEVMSRLVVDSHQQHFADLDLTLAQAQVLRLLRRGPVPTGQLAAALHISPPAVTQLTNRLIAKELIERHASPSDRRLVLVTLSPKGTRMVERFRKRRAEIFCGALSRLRAEEQGRVVKSFGRMREALEEYELEVSAAGQGKAPRHDMKLEAGKVKTKGSRK
ncbi:MAG: MarR family transcriptional regulator [Pyrinomonadaceae bacterium]